MDYHQLNAHTRPLGLLLSDKVNQQYGLRFEELAEKNEVVIRRYPLTGVGEEDYSRIDAAFFSRDLYAGSSMISPSPLSSAFFRIVNNAKMLQWLHVCSSGLDLPQYATSLARGIHVTTSSGSTAIPIAQTTMAAMLSLSRGFGHWLPAQASRNWAPLSGDNLPADITSQHVLIAGAGAIGQALGRMLLAVGFRVTAVRRKAIPLAPFDSVIDYSQLDHALATCDWLVLALPLNQETRGIIDRRRLALMPSSAYIANIGRGALIDEEALTEALSYGRIAGAYLDTFVREPLPPASPLWGLPNVWITPHNSSASRGHEQRVVEKFEHEYKKWLNVHVKHSPS